ncbi:putative glycolipid-binding domain-containing protein [Rhodocytophaga aerolata]|uniref:Glycolipid-binding domain-containing protein n=1 Tax=Rhodocytophaga aerolata TaxID=455078 RepID=A0ABT8RGK4_9BACT|nr:putative glycolipid-binding domain-containing protein [Rhodocytophaga aerolata]MDO1451237.1 putative glycolipid-binding domain-containing protein [Rhodocytophaga aerolata]
MQTNILWRGLEYDSLENCLVTTTQTGYEINSVIVGRYEGKIYRVEYRIETNQLWQTLYFEVKSQHSNQIERFTYQMNGQGKWMSKGKPVPQFDGCIDIDIPLTPFTNSLPINRLKLNHQEVEQIGVIYLDVLERQIRPVRQQYRRLSDTTYHYQNVPNDFEAVITVDALGLVEDYPQLFLRAAQLESNYI